MFHKIALLLFFGAFALTGCSQPKSNTNPSNNPTSSGTNNPKKNADGGLAMVDVVNQEKNNQNMDGLEKATLGAGCFWCVEAVFQDLDGVVAVESGYMGGQIPNPTYKQVCEGNTGHAEVAQITYDPKKITFEQLLEVFWVTHDPTTLNRQGGDVGTQYRSAIFYHNDAQKAAAEKSKKEAAALYDSPIVTEITAVSTFYKAEDYHQNYFNLNADRNPYCSSVIAPKVVKFRKQFGSKLKEEIKP